MNNETSRYVADRNADAQKYAADRGLSGQLGVAQINADANRYGVDAQTGLGYAQLNSQSKTTNTQNTVKTIDTAVQNINNIYKNNETGKAKGDSIIMGSNGSYYLNPSIDRNTYLDLIINAVLSDNSLDSNTKDALFRELNITDKEVDRVATYTGKGG